MNDAIGECASPVLDDARWLVSRYTCCNVPTVFSLFSCCSLIFAGWVNRHQLDVIEYLQEENRVLKEHLGGRRIRLTDTERRRLARRAHTLGRKVLNELRTLVTPDTHLAMVPGTHAAMMSCSAVEQATVCGC